MEKSKHWAAISAVASAVAALASCFAVYQSVQLHKIADEAQRPYLILDTPEEKIISTEKIYILTISGGL